MPFAADLGIRLEEATPDRVVALLPWATRLCTAGGLLHGGVMMALADSAGALVAYLGLPEGASTATLTSTTQMFRPVLAGGVRAVAVAAPRPHCCHRADDAARRDRPAGGTNHSDPGNPDGELGIVGAAETMDAVLV